MTRLDNIATRQRRSRFSDVLFAALVAVAAAVSISTMHTAIVASSQIAQH
jgi:hypothetical protein